MERRGGGEQVAGGLRKHDPANRDDQPGATGQGGDEDIAPFEQACQQDGHDGRQGEVKTGAAPTEHATQGEPAGAGEPRQGRQEDDTLDCASGLRAVLVVCHRSLSLPSGWTR